MSDLLPANSTAQERAISDSIERAGSVPVVVREVWNPDACPSNMLAWLAWAFSVDEWNSGWSTAQKREMIKASISVHRHKGTIGAVRSALSALSYDSQVQEWFAQSPAGTPYTFRLLLTADQVGIPHGAVDAILAVIDRVKNLRSHLELVQVIARTQAGPTIGAVSMIGNELCVSNYVYSPIVLNETTIRV